MAKEFGRASKYIEGNIRKNAFVYFLALFIFLVGLVWCFKLATDIFGGGNSLSAWILLMVYLFCIISLVKAFKYIFSIDYFFRGGQGENIIAEELSKLPDTYSIFRGVHVNNSKADIDVVVLGPKGIFIVEVKSHSGRITYNGRELLKNGYRIQEKDILKQARHEAGSLAEYLKTLGLTGYIKPIIVFSNSRTKVNFGMQPVDGVVYVVGKNWLTKLIYSFPDSINTASHASIEQILETLVEK